MIFVSELAQGPFSHLHQNLLCRFPVPIGWNEHIGRIGTTISGTSWKILEEDVNMYQEGLGIAAWTKMLQRILEVTGKGCHNVSIPGTSSKLLEEDTTTYRYQRGLGIEWRR